MLIHFIPGILGFHPTMTLALLNIFVEILILSQNRNESAEKARKKQK